MMASHASNAAAAAAAAAVSNGNQRLDDPVHDNSDSVRLFGKWSAPMTATASWDALSHDAFHSSAPVAFALTVPVCIRPLPCWQSTLSDCLLLYSVLLLFVVATVDVWRYAVLRG